MSKSFLFNAKPDFPKSWVWLLALLGVGGFFYLTRDILLPFAVGAFIAYLLDPLASKMARKMGRSVATVLSLFLFFTFFVFAFLGAIPLIKAEILLLSKKLPGYLDQFYAYTQPWIKLLKGHLIAEKQPALDQSIQENFSSIFAWGLRFLARFFSSTLAVANLLSLIIITPIVVFYLLRDWPGILKSLDQLLPRKSAPMIRELFSKINSVLGGYARGQLSVCMILAFYYALTLKLVGLPYGITIGLFAGLFAFVPYFGFLVGIVAAFGMALSHFDNWTVYALIGGIFFVGQVVESYVLLPKLVGDKVGLHPLWILFSLLAGGVLMGFLGLLIAMPLAAAIGVVVRFIVAKYKQANVSLPDKKEESDG